MLKVSLRIWNSKLRLTSYTFYGWPRIHFMADFVYFPWLTWYTFHGWLCILSMADLVYFSWLTLYTFHGWLCILFMADLAYLFRWLHLLLKPSMALLIIGRYSCLSQLTSSWLCFKHCLNEQVTGKSHRFEMFTLLQSWCLPCYTVDVNSTTQLMLTLLHSWCLPYYSSYWLLSNSEPNYTQTFQLIQTIHLCIQAQPEPSKLARHWSMLWLGPEGLCPLYVLSVVDTEWGTALELQLTVSCLSVSQSLAVPPE